MEIIHFYTRLKIKNRSYVIIIQTNTPPSTWDQDKEIVLVRVLLFLRPIVLIPHGIGRTIFVLKNRKCPIPIYIYIYKRLPLPSNYITVANPKFADLEIRRT